MKEIMQKLLNGISYTFLIVILSGIYLPGILVIVISKWDLFLKLDIFKLSVLATIMAVPSFVVVFLIIGTFGVFGCVIKKIKPESVKNEIITYTILGNWMVAGCYLNSIGINFSAIVKKIFCIAVLCGIVIGFIVFVDFLFRKE